MRGWHLVLHHSLHATHIETCHDFQMSGQLQAPAELSALNDVQCYRLQHLITAQERGWQCRSGAAG